MNLNAVLRHFYFVKHFFSMFETFFNKALEIVDKHIPIKQVSKRKLKIKSKPWITPAIKVSIQVKNRLFKKFVKTKSTYYHLKFKFYRNKINHLIRISKKQYYNNFFKKNATSSKQVWRGIKEIINVKSQASLIPTKIIDNDCEVIDPKQIANAFNKYFANVGNHLASTIPCVNKSPIEYLPAPLCDSFYLYPTTSEEIGNEISNLKNGKATGPFSIPVSILKILQTVISKPLEIVFNTSFSMGIVPESLKLAKIIPVFKKGSQTSLSNYRPISLLSIFDKLLEKLMYKRLLDFIEKRNIFYNKQFGFRSNHSTDHAILSIIDKIQKAIDERNFSCGLFLDLSKAFDTVNHKILINKLKNYGIRGVAQDWLTSYLCDRKQMVYIGNVSSDQEMTTCGVPQGSVLGPLLFLLYINDFHLCSDLFDFHLFADDANLFCKHKNLITLESNLNRELNNIYTWLCAKRLSLNFDKSNFVIFHPPQKKIHFNVKLSINNIELKQEHYIKYLGILIDSNLSWKPQVNYIAKKIKRSIGILSKLRYYVNCNVLVNLYYSLIYPFLIYGILAWGNTYTTTLNPLYILQKKATRIITFSKFDDHSSPLFKQLNIIKLNDLVTLHISIFMHKYYNHLLPSVFECFFTEVKKIHSYNTRLSSKLSYSLPKVRTNYAIFNIRFQGAKVWNSLDEKVKLLSLSLFKKSIIFDFIEKY